MSKNIFTRSNEKTKDVNVNTFDLSFQNNLTMKFGALYPVFCKPCNPKESFSIDPVFGLNFMPMYFPVQTRMRANLHFFYVRNRNLWKDWMDFYGKTKDNLIPPYHDCGNPDVFSNICKTSSLGDYLGVPTTLVGDYGRYTSATQYMYNLESRRHYVSEIPATIFNAPDLRSYLAVRTLSEVINTSVVPSNGVRKYHAVIFDNFDSPLIAGLSQKVTFSLVGNTLSDFQNSLLGPDSFLEFYNSSGQPVGFSNNPVFSNSSFSFVSDDVLTQDATSAVLFIHDADSAYSYYTSDGSFLGGVISDLVLTIGGTTGVVVDDIQPDSSPYWSSSSSKSMYQQTLSALPARAYESVYNGFYRDIRNNPYMLNGVAEYNKYIPSLEGGPDTYPYTLRYRNWEQDFLTSAVQSPQMGVAPLVGITSSGALGFMDSDGVSYTADMSVSDDGDSINGITVSRTSEALTSARNLVGLASSGISINDFRNVNALQLWLEANNRLGFRYKDQIKAHFDVDIRFDELQMPEFIGGTSQDISVNQINQQSDSNDMPLGSYAGQAYCRGGSSNTIRHYCDEPGFIIGILSVSPVPNYSQLLPKHFTYNSTLDYFFPEFGHVGMQPITYSEVCPVQAFQESVATSKDVLRETFGYQRAYYDLLASTDEVHGLFRTNLRNYLINRVFNVKPALAPSFLLIDPKQTNDVFSVNTPNDDKILGQVYFKCSVKRPIPLFGHPRLE